MRTGPFYHPTKDHTSSNHDWISAVKRILTLSLLVVLFLAPACRNSAEVPDARPVEVKSVSKNLAQLVNEMKEGMSRPQVLEVLGEPTWAAIPGDRGDYRIREEGIKLILYWRNPGAPPVTVTFDEAYRSVKWTDGLPKKGTYEQIFEPYDSYLCSLPDRQEFCK